MTKTYIHITVRVPNHLLNDVEDDAARRNLKRSEWLRIAIQNELNREQNRNFLQAKFQAMEQYIEDSQIAIMQHVTAELAHSRKRKRAYDDDF